MKFYIHTQAGRHFKCDKKIHPSVTKTVTITVKLQKKQRYF